MVVWLTMISGKFAIIDSGTKLLVGWYARFGYAAAATDITPLAPTNRV